MPPVNPELRGDGGATQVSAIGSSLTPTVSEVAPESARSIELVLNRHEPDEAEICETAARAHAGFKKVKLHISAMGAADAHSTQAALVRDALSRHPVALIVEPNETAEPDLAAMIEDVRRQGIPVVLAGRTPDGKTPAAPSRDATGTKSSDSAGQPAPIILIEPQFTASAKQIVTATIRLTRVSDLEPNGGAIIVTNSVGDSYIADRLLAIKDALHESGITAIEEVLCTKDTKAGEKLLAEHLKAHPKIHMVFGVDSPSSAIVREVLNTLIAGRLLIAGCYTTEDQVITARRLPVFAAVAEFSPSLVIRKAISTAIDLAEGKEVPPIVDYPINVSESLVKSNILHQRYLQSKKAEQEKAQRKN